MATAGHIPGKLWKLLHETVAIDDLTSVTLNCGRDSYDITSYDSANWSEIAPSTRNWSVDIEFICQYDATEGYDELMDDYLADVSTTELLTTGVTGDTTLSGEGYIMSINKSGSLGDKVTVSVSITGTGALTKGTVA